jgi:hypothetical protein
MTASKLPSEPATTWTTAVLLAEEPGWLTVIFVHLFPGPAGARPLSFAEQKITRGRICAVKQNWPVAARRRLPALALARDAYKPPLNRANFNE